MRDTSFTVLLKSTLICSNCVQAPSSCMNNGNWRGHSNELVVYFVSQTSQFLQLSGRAVEWIS